MPTKIINSNTIFYNKFTRFGRKRNNAIEYLLENGYPIIKERKQNCNSRVLLGYKDSYSKLANIAMRVNRDGSFETKTTKATRSPLPSSKKTYEISKTKSDNKGNYTTTYKKFSIFNRLIERVVNKKSVQNGITDIEYNSQKINEGVVVEKSEYKNKLNGLDISSYQYIANGSNDINPMIEYPELAVSKDKLSFLKENLKELFEYKLVDFFTIFAHDTEDKSYFEIFKTKNTEL